MSDPNDDLRQLLSDATADIRPQGTFHDIQDRLEKVDPMARRWFLPVIAAAAVITLAIGGAIYATRNTDKPAPGPTGNPTGSAKLVDRAVPVYYVGDAAQGKRLFREFQRQQVCEGDTCLLAAAAQTAVESPPDDPDYTTAAWPATTIVVGTTFDGNVITVDLNGPNLADEVPGGSLAVQQLIFSAQAGLGKGRVPVQLLVGGKKSATVLGVPTSAPLLAADELDVLAPVQITTPTNGLTVKPGNVTVTGVAATFEANVVWELMVGGDGVVASGHTTAAECCKLAPYTFVLKDLQPGAYTLVVHDTDESGSGRPVNQDTKEIVVE